MQSNTESDLGRLKDFLETLVIVLYKLNSLTRTETSQASAHLALTRIPNPSLLAQSQPV